MSLFLIAGYDTKFRFNSEYLRKLSLYLRQNRALAKNLWSRSPCVRCEEFQSQELVSLTLIFRPKSFATLPPMYNFPVDRDVSLDSHQFESANHLAWIYSRLLPSSQRCQSHRTYQCRVKGG